MKHELSANQTTFSFTVKNAAAAFSMPGFAMKNLTPVLKLDGKDVPVKRWEIMDSSPKSIEAKGSAAAAELEWKALLTRDGAVRLQLKARLKKAYKDVELYYFAGQTLEGTHVLNQTGSTGGIPLTKGTDTDFTGSLFFALTCGGRQLCLSYPMQCGHVPEFFGHAGNGAVTDFKTGSVLHNYSGKIIVLEPLTIRAGDGFQILDVYGDENRKTEKEQKVEPAGWNSWDYYRWTITEDEVLANARFIANDPVLSKYVKKFTIDDGWQYAYGEWDANPYFPHGMKYLAKELKKMKFEPGLWICPMICEPHSMMAQLDGELFFRSEAGHPCCMYNCMNRMGMVLDPTNKKVQDHIENLIRKYTDMGYMHFKLDFLMYIMKAVRSCHPSVPRGHYIREVIAAARRGAAGRARILGCGFPLYGGDIVDSCRISSDIHARWGSIKSNERAIAAHYWMNNKLFRNDPDFALCRALDTSDDPEINRLQPCWIMIPPDCAEKDHPLATFRQVDVTRQQSEILLSLVIVSGGIVNLSDKMMLLNESGLDLARRTVSAEVGGTGIPLDLFDAENPRFWLQKISGGHRVLMINWSEDREQELVVDLDSFDIKASSAVNFWNDKKLKIVKGHLSAVLPPRSCLFAVVK